MKINKLLIVDDEKPISSYLNRKLSKLGYTVYIAEDGEEALEQAFAHLPDLILLDVKLPKLDGLSVCQRLKSDPRTDKIPVVILSAKAQSEEISDRRFDAGCGLLVPVHSQDQLLQVIGLGTRDRKPDVGYDSWPFFFEHRQGLARFDFTKRT